MDVMRVPSVDECVVRNLLESNAAERGDDLFIRFLGNRDWTFADTLDEARRAAWGLRQLGVKQGDVVFCWMPNGEPLVRTWLGINYLGAVYMPANIAYTGKLLQHALDLAGAKIAIIHADLMPRLEGIDLGGITDIVVHGSTDVAIDGVALHDIACLKDAPAEAGPPLDIQPWDIVYNIYTSGTTGKSKAVACSYAQVWHFYAHTWTSIFGRNERYMLNLPLFHAGGCGTLYGQLANGGSVVLVESFKTDKFWSIVDENAITSASLLGAMGAFLLAQPPVPTDRAHSLKAVIATPYSAQAVEFGQRFGVDVYSSYSMTELSCPLVTPANPEKLDVVGRKRNGFELRIVDDNDIEVPTGTPGELLVRTAQPWALFSGYVKNEAATAEAWRNGWFHTGDVLRVDEDGDYFFVDRKKDVIRRRGENISAYEVEQEVLAFDGVQEVAAVAVPSSRSEDEVLVCVLPKPGIAIDLRELTSFLLERTPHYMVPRYFRIVADLPRTPTLKVQKFLLREEGVTDDTWDREEAGIFAKRTALGA